tara:strand:+ start:2462 stop:3178 length:717 start_codon:yes stop_codon:yes gene_type:complete
MIAVLYSSVGFGGGSSYLAILALTGITFTELRLISLACNIVVVSVNVFHFQKQKMYDWKKVIPIIFFSIPLAFIGGYIEITQKIFFIFLGCTLLIASITMWFTPKIISNHIPKSSISISKNTMYSGLIGFISGMVGIGGGIFLAPLLYVRQWDSPMRIAAIASLFILLNSLSGIIGQSFNPKFSINWYLIIPLLVTVFIGAYIGSKINNRYLTPNQIKKGTAIIIAYVSIQILSKYIF